MKALRKSSVAGLEATLQTNATKNVGQTNAIGILNGDSSTEGSLAKMVVDLNAYTDTTNDNVDLPQMDANTASIALLNDTTPGKVGSVQTQLQGILPQTNAYADTSIVDGTSDQNSTLKANVAIITGYIGDYIPTDRNGLNYSNYYPKVNNLTTTGFNIWVCDAVTDTDSVFNNHSAADKRNDVGENLTLKAGDKVLYQYGPAQDGADEYFYILYVQRKDGVKTTTEYVPADCVKDSYSGTPVSDTNINSNDDLYVRTTDITLGDYANTFQGDGDATTIYYGNGLDENTVLTAGWLVNAYAINGTASNPDQDAPGADNEVHIDSIKKEVTIVDNGTIKNKVDELINNADVLHDTLNELVTSDAGYEQELSDLTDVVAANKQSGIDDLQAQKDTAATDAVNRNDKFDTERTQTNTDIADAITANNDVADGKYSGIANLFGGLADGDKSSCRYNLDIIDANSMKSNFATDYHNTYKITTNTVKGGKIKLPTDVTLSRLKYVHLLHPGNEYDDITPVIGENPGEFIINTGTDGDLDDTDVSVRYVTWEPPANMS